MNRLPRPPPDAQVVLRIETDLAKGSLDLVSRRDPNQVYHKMSVKDLAALAPDHRLAEIFSRRWARPPSPISMSRSRIFSRLLNAVLKQQQRRRSQDLSSLAPAARRSAFAVQGLCRRKLSFLRPDAHWRHRSWRPAGSAAWKPPMPTWASRSARSTWSKTFPPDAKARVLGMVQEIETMLGQDIQIARLDDARHQGAGA